MEEDHSFLFLKKNLMKIFFLLKNLEILNFLKELKILINDFFFGSNLRSTSPMPLVPRPFLKISFFFFFFFLKILEILNFFMELKFLIDIYFFFLKNLEILNFFKEFKILNFFFGKTYPLNENNFGRKLIRITG